MRQTLVIAIILAGLVACSPEKSEKEDVNSTSENVVSEFNSAFAHTVYFWLKNPESKSDRDTFLRSLQKFLNNSEYAQTCFIGTPPEASREVVDGSFTFSLILSFPSAEAQDMYQEENAHRIFIDESADLWEKVIVYDSEGVKLESTQQN